MSKLHHPALHLVCALAVASGLVAVACVGGDDDVDNNPSSGGSGGGDTGGTSGGDTGGAPATGGTSGGDTGGSDAGTTPQPLCAMKSALPSATLLDFEALTASDGATVIGTSTIQVGTYVYVDPMDATATQARALIEGHDATSTKAISTTIHSSTWGGGMGVWFNPGCLDATAYMGVSFWAKSAAPPATTPAGTVLLSLNMVDTVGTDGGGNCATTPCEGPSYSFVVTDTWTPYTVHWADFTPGVSGTTMITANGDDITGLNFNLGNDNMARDIAFDLDDVVFLTD